MGQDDKQGRFFADLDDDERSDVDDPTLPLVRSVLPGAERLDDSAPRLQLIGIGPGPATIVLRADQAVLGRGTASDIVIDSASLSRAHVRLERRGPDVVVTDLESRNGLFLNGLRVHSAVLRDRDSLQLGDLRYRFRSSG